MTTKLTSRERMTRMLARREHDRVPRFDMYWPETITRWTGEGLVDGEEGARARLASDVRLVGIPWAVPYPGREEIVREDAETKTINDALGNTMRVWKSRSGTPEHIAFGCDSRAKWEQQYRPALLQAEFPPPGVWQKDQYRRAQEQRQWTCFIGLESFESIRQLMGDEITLMAMVEEPDWIREMSRTYTDLLLAGYEQYEAAGFVVDGVWVCGDVGYNHGPFFSPAAYREVIWPDHRRMCEWAHQRGKPFIYHTDGDVRTLLDAFVDGEFDCLQPLEAKANMDVRQLAPQYGRRFSFFGNIDMTVAIRGDRDELDHEVRTKLAAGMANRGYAYHSDHSVPPQVSWDTYQFIIKLLERYGTYR